MQMQFYASVTAVRCRDEQWNAVPIRQWMNKKIFTGIHVLRYVIALMNDAGRLIVVSRFFMEEKIRVLWLFLTFT